MSHEVCVQLLYMAASGRFGAAAKRYAMVMLTPWMIRLMTSIDEWIAAHPGESHSKSAPRWKNFLSTRTR